MSLKVAELAYVRLQLPDLDEAERFFTTFGLPTRVRTDDRLYVRAGGPEHHVIVAQRGERRLLAIAFEVRTEEDLQRATQIEGASAIEPIDGPGGGSRVTVVDPDGNPIELVYGIEKSAALAASLQHLNSAAARTQRRNSVVRPHHGPARVMRIGHVVPRTPDVARMVAWYTRTLGFLESDDVPVPKGDGLLMSFLRLDQGDVPVDHHVMQVLLGGANQMHHISFEVQAIDDIHVGHQALREGGYTPVWGIGRHVQGSQIFDYWLDTFGIMYEHWTDTDMFDSSVPKGCTRLDDMHAPWGPPMPQAFLTQGTR